MNAKRGYVPEDERNFSSAALEKMRIASRHVGFLINEGYDLKQAATFVGNHFLLSERQRLAIMRSLATKEQLVERSRKEVSSASGKAVYIDGFNIIITLEVLLCDSIFLFCMDGTIRDLAALRGDLQDYPGNEGRCTVVIEIPAGNRCPGGVHSSGRAGIQFRTVESVDR